MSVEVFAPTLRLVSHLGRGGDARPAVEYDYSEGRGGDAEIERELKDGSRVVFIDGDLGDGLVPIGDSDFDSFALTERSWHLPGRETRAVVLSVEDLPDGPLRESTWSKLRRAGRNYRDKHAPGCRYILTGHGNRAHPHGHMRLENFDVEHGGRRLNWSPAMCERMQDVESWTDEFRSGKGSGDGGFGVALTEPPDPVDPDAPTHAEQVAVVKFSAATRRETKLAELRTLLGQGETRESLFESGRLTVRERSTAGRLLARPSFTFANEKFRCDTLVARGHHDIVAALGLPTTRHQREVEPSRHPKKSRRETALASLQTNDFDRLIREGRLTFRHRRNPDESALIYEGVTFRSRTLRRDGRDEIAGLISRDAHQSALKQPVTSPSLPSTETTVLHPRTGAEPASIFGHLEGTGHLIKDGIEALTDPAKDGAKLAAKAGEALVSKVIDSLAGSHVGVIKTGVHLLQGAATGDAPAKMAMRAAKSVVALAVPGATPLLAGLEAIKRVADAFADPSPAEPLLEDMVMSREESLEVAPPAPPAPAKPIGAAVRRKQIQDALALLYWPPVGGGGEGGEEIDPTREADPLKI